MRFDYQLHGAGWAVATVRDSGREVAMTVSYLHDSLTQLAEAVLALLAGEVESSVVFMDEPGEHHLVIRQDSDNMTIQVRWFADWASWKMHPTNQYQVVFKCRSALTEVREQVVAVFEGLLNQHGVEGYRKQWRSDFPLQLYQQLLAS